jgi:hypothetical protein
VDVSHNVADERERRYTAKSECGELWDTKGRTAWIQDRVDIVIVSTLVECVYKMNHLAALQAGEHSHNHMRGYEARCPVCTGAKHMMVSRIPEHGESAYLTANIRSEAGC